MAPTAITNGYTDHNVALGLSSQKSLAGKDSAKLTAEEDLVLKAFRVLIADLCQQFKGGHPG
jgi:dihydroxyacetone synthase